MSTRNDLELYVSEREAAFINARNLVQALDERYPNVHLAMGNLAAAAAELRSINDDLTRLEQGFLSPAPVSTINEAEEEWYAI